MQFSAASQMAALVNKLLTGVSNVYVPTGLISETLLPNIPVKQKSGILGKYGKQHLRIHNSLMGGRGKAPRVSTITRDLTTQYLVESHGLEDVCTEDDYDNVEDPYDVQEDVTMGVTTSLFLGKEIALATTLADSTVVTQNVTLAGNAQFDDYDNSDPLSKFKDAQNAVRNGCGLPPNTAWLDWQVANTLRYHPQIYDRLGIKYNAITKLTNDQLAMAMDVETLLITNCLYNNSQEGQADNMVPVWGKHIWFGVIPAKAAKRQVSLGYYLTMVGEGPRTVYKYPEMNPPGTDVILVQDKYDMLISDATAVYGIFSAIS